jgi:hypothetical protein
MACRAIQIMRGGHSTDVYLIKQQIDQHSRIAIEEFFPACYTSVQTLECACAETLQKARMELYDPKRRSKLRLPKAPSHV